MEEWLELHVVKCSSFSNQQYAGQSGQRKHECLKEESGLVYDQKRFCIYKTMLSVGLKLGEESFKQ